MGMLIGLVVYFLPVAATINNNFLDWRMSATTLPASGNVVFVAIDARSLRGIGTWPWSRSVHADILEQLVDAGAADILFDINFAFPSDPIGDAAFADALERAGGSTLLATFAQTDRVGLDSKVVFNLPYQPFQNASWPATVNVVGESDGLIRRYLTGAKIGSEFVPSAATLLAAGKIEENGQFEINYGISPMSIPTLSAIDVATGDFDAESIRGRSIIVGAAAIELGDHFAVPLHQVIPGALVHATATETLLLDAGILRARPEPTAIAVIVAVLTLSYLYRRRPWRLIGAISLVSVGIEIIALIIFQNSYIYVPTASIHPALVGFCLTSLAASLDVSALILRHKNLQIKNTEALLTHLFDQSSDGIVILDETGRVVMNSASAVDMFGIDIEGSIDLPDVILERARAAANDAEYCSLGAPTVDTHFCNNNNSRSIEYITVPSVFHELGSNEANPTTHRITAVSARDVTELKEREREIAYLSTHDERTGALRRQTFLEFLSLQLKQEEYPTMVLALNLHRLKSINMAFGRDIGDAVLKEVVSRLQGMDVGIPAIARLDGDTFAFFLNDIASAEVAEALADRVLALISEPYTFGEGNVQIGAQIGYYLTDVGDELSAADALGRTEDALDAARSFERPNIRLYDPTAALKRMRFRAVERAMPGAIERSELHVVYQPQHSLKNGAMTGVEALVRWDSPTLGQVSPDEFISIAETSGFIIELGRFVLLEAARDAMELPENITMAVNVSSIQLERGDFRATVSDVLSLTGLAPARLCLELTESVMLSQDDVTIGMMQDIAKTGVTWAMDDFGTGFSSMAYLSRLPLSKIKLDQSFTMALSCDPTSTTILRSVALLCEGLGLGLLCEGVETPEQVEILKDEGSAEGQGYYFGKPQSHTDILASLHSQSLEAKRTN